jgi:hypothetical protein
MPELHSFFLPYILMETGRNALAPWFLQSDFLLDHEFNFLNLKAGAVMTAHRIPPHVHGSLPHC